MILTDTVCLTTRIDEQLDLLLCLIPLLLCLLPN